jgi:hypothetical protein
MAELLPIKFFSKREEDKQRVEGNPNKDLPKWVLSGDELKAKSMQLTIGLDNVVAAVKWEDRTVPVIMQATLNKDAYAKSHRKKIESIFITKENNVLGVGDENTLLIKVDSLEEIKEIQKKILDVEKNAYGISGIDDIKKFHAIVELVDNYENYKVKLFNFHDYSINMSNCTKFELLLRNKGIVFNRSEYAKSLIVYKICNINEAVLDELLDEDMFDLAEKIIPMPSFELAMDSIGTDRVVSVKYPDGNKKTTIVGVLDNGIEPINELKPWLYGKRMSPYPDNSIISTHGTFVAGVITYGDELQEKELTGSKNIMVFDGAIYPDTRKERIDEDELIANIKEIIKQNHNEIKIWNLSISITREISDSRFSDFAIALDEIQDDYNVLICKSAGNCINFSRGLPLGKIHEGADSVRSLVVGSVADNKEGVDISEPGNPSPFSRKGPGPAYIIKPDIVHYGGNAGVDSKGKIIESGVYSFSKNGTIVEKAGTSFSTPRVAALAAGLSNEMDEDFDPLLLKALIIHSANYSPNLLVPEVERTKYLGFGVPASVRNILYNSSDEATLILRDTLPKGRYIDIKDFPMPDCLAHEGFYTGQIIVTLVYEPVLDPSQGFEYCQSNMDVKLGSYDEKTVRDTTRNGILNPVGRRGSQNILVGNIYSKVKMREGSEEFALKERMLIQYADKYYPVKKYAVDLSELTEGNKIKYAAEGKKWYLKLDGTYRSNAEDRALIEGNDLSQEFCLIITIKDPAHQGKLYNGISQKLDEFNFWHSNIKISENINITI